MSERKGIVTMGGKPVTLAGTEVKAGDRAPDFTALNTYLQEVKLDKYKGMVVALVSVPSLDTPVCDLEGKRFNREAGQFGKDVKILTISMDLPFAQKRWCAAAEVDNIETLSDHREADFGLKYGVLMKESRLLARAVFVIDREGVVRYVEIVPEVGKEPDYDAALAAVKKLVK